MMSDGDNDGQMMFGDLAGLKLPDICLTGEEEPRKTSPSKLVPTGVRTRARCVTGAHATACSTSVDLQITYAMLFDSCSHHQLFLHSVSVSLNIHRPKGMELSLSSS